MLLSYSMLVIDSANGIWNGIVQTGKFPIVELRQSFYISSSLHGSTLLGRKMLSRIARQTFKDISEKVTTSIFMA
jgi:hypothetical protein